MVCKQETLVERLRKRAEIRRKATCRGPEDRLANDLDEAAERIEKLERVLRKKMSSCNVARFIVKVLEDQIRRMRQPGYKFKV